MTRGRKVTVLTIAATSIFNYVVGGLPLWIDLSVAVFSYAFMVMAGERLATWAAGTKQFEELVNNVALEPPAKCGTCGASFYIADRDDDNQCDECWDKAEKVSMEQIRQEAIEYRDRVREREREITRRGIMQ